MNFNVVNFSQIECSEGKNLESKGSNVGGQRGHDDAVEQCKGHQLRGGFKLQLGANLGLVIVDGFV